jgi:hypothetical protein
VIFLSVYCGVFEDPLFTKQARAQLEATDTPSALASLQMMLADLSESLTGPVLSQLQEAESSSTEPVSPSQQDQILLSVVRMAPALSDALAIPAVPSILDCLSAILLAVDEIYAAPTAADRHAREAPRVQLSDGSVDDICLRILAARKRELQRTKGSPVNVAEREYWNTVVKSCLCLLMNLTFRCAPAQVLAMPPYSRPLLTLGRCRTRFGFVRACQWCSPTVQQTSRTRSVGSLL